MTTPTGTEPLLRSCAISAGYGRLMAIRDVSLEVGAREAVGLLGANGAGKSTALMALVGEVDVYEGTVEWFGSCNRRDLVSLARAGVGVVPERSSLVRALTVADNLRMADASVDLAIEWFPALSRLLNRQAGLLSGGEQQMVTLARALARGPRVLLVDELSLGLAPAIAERLAEVLRHAVDRDGIGMLVVEQDVDRALSLADRIYVLRGGRIVAEGPTSTFRGTRRTELEQLLLASGEEPAA